MHTSFVRLGRDIGINKTRLEYLSSIYLTLSLFGISRAGPDFLAGGVCLVVLEKVPSKGS